MILHSLWGILREEGGQPYPKAGKSANFLDPTDHAVNRTFDTHGRVFDLECRSSLVLYVQEGYVERPTK